jgi:hypothetical protein
MRRKLFFIMTLVSLLLCALSAWWWIGSFGRLTQVSLRNGGDSSYQVVGANGTVALARTPVPAANGGQLSWSAAPYSVDAAIPDSGQSSLHLPMWGIVLAFAFLPFSWVGLKMKKANKH